MNPNIKQETAVSSLSHHSTMLTTLCCHSVWQNWEYFSWWIVPFFIEGAGTKQGRPQFEHGFTKCNIGIIVWSLIPDYFINKSIENIFWIVLKWEDTFQMHSSTHNFGLNLGSVQAHIFQFTLLSSSSWYFCALIKIWTPILP